MKLKALAVSMLAVAALTVAVSGFPFQQKGHLDEVTKFLDEVWTKGNVAYVDQAMDPKIVRYGHVLDGDTSGIPAYKELVTKIRSQFTDYNIRLLDMMGVGNKATFTWELKGNYVGPDKKLSPGRPVDLIGKTVWLFSGDKVVREVVQFDSEEYNRQIANAQPYTEAGCRAIMLGFLYDVVRAGDMPSLEALVSDKHVLHAANNREVTGLTGLREHITALRAAFPEMGLQIHEIIANANIVTARWTLVGVQKSEWNGIAPSNAKRNITGLTMMRIKDDKITETWNVLDLSPTNPKDSK